MNSTPNYGFEKNIQLCALDAVDRELKRLEEKIDCHHRTASYSKCETDRLLDGKVDKKDGCRLICEEELRDIHDALGDRYTKGDADGLLAEKVDKVSPQSFQLPLEEGYTAYYACTYQKTQENLVLVTVACTSDTEILSGSVIATLPENFRPANRMEVPASVSRVGNHERWAATLVPYENDGGIRVYHNAENARFVFGQMFFVAAEE